MSITTIFSALHIQLENSHLIVSYLLDRIQKNGLENVIYSIKRQHFSQSASELRHSLITIGVIESVFSFVSVSLHQFTYLLVCGINV